MDATAGGCQPDSIKTKVYVWGQSGNCQLGIEPNVDGFEEEPTELSPFDNCIITAVALGLRHSLILTSKGLVSIGCNDCRQLGRRVENDAGDRQPGQVDSLSDKNVIAVAVGEAHSLALTIDGVVYSWGDNQRGQLGRAHSCNTAVGTVEFPQATNISQISCGEYHNIALSRDGLIYTWGSNQYGQLGQGSVGENRQLPRAIASVRALNFIKIAAGGNHSFALTVSGALFGWGRNSNGQLGLGNCEDKAFPVCCRALRQQRVRHISCGVSHSAALTKDGGVFTFGAGTHGQLGHNVSQDECRPKKVLELMGSTVTQLACGRYHTLALVPSSGRAYSFGLGSSGQLGVSGTHNVNTPSHVKGPWSTGVSRDPAVQLSIRRITAGGHGCLVYVENQQCSSVGSTDHRTINSQRGELGAELITNIVNTCESGTGPSRTSQTLDPNLEYAITTAFSQGSVWNGAFLKQYEDDPGCSSSNHGLELDVAKEELSRLSQCSNLVAKQLIGSSVEQRLLPSLAEKIADVECLRAFLIVPFLPMFSEPKNFSTVQAPFGNALVGMDQTATKVIDKWLLSIARRHFRYYLFTFKNVIQHVLLLDTAPTEYEALARQRGTQTCLDVMAKLYKINETENEEQKVPCTDFYIPEVTYRVNINQDYYSWYTKSQMASNGAPLLLFSNYAFVFDALAKTTLLQTDALIQMQQAIDQAHRLNLMNILSSSAEIDTVHPCLVITVSRDSLVHDTLVSFNKHGSADLKKPLKVQFRNEEAVDEGGVRKEFFLLILKEVLHLKYGMFQSYEESRLLWFNATTFEDDMAMYHLIGLLCGLAIYNLTIVDLPFPVALYKKLLNKPVNLDDLRELDPMLGKSLQDLLDYDGDDVADVFCLTFSISANQLDQVVTMDLIPNGNNVAVTNDNRQEYVHKYVSYIFDVSVEKMFSAFHVGFHKVCGSKVLAFFHPLELQSMVVGNEEYNWEELEQNCDYKGEFYKHHDTIEMFWQVFHDLSQSEKREFLRFLTGCDRIPIQGMKSLKMLMQPMQTSEEYLPVAHTCFNLLDLPVKYSSKEKLSKKLLVAIANAEGFGLV